MSHSPPRDPEARARWHLEIGYSPALSEDDEEIDERGDEEYHEPATCWKCGGEGIIVFCMDDLCHGAGHCIHGDGDAMCPACRGEGVL